MARFGGPPFFLPGDSVAGRHGTAETSAIAPALSLNSPALTWPAPESLYPPPGLV